MATHTRETLLAIVEKIRYDTTNIQMNVTELARAIAVLPIPAPQTGTHLCPHDNLKFPSEKRLAEHLANVHDSRGPGSLMAEIRHERFGNRPIPNMQASDKLITDAEEAARNSEVAFGHARAAEDVGSDVSKLTCRDEQVDG